MRFLLVLALFLLAAIGESSGTESPQLSPTQKMAYRVKPAIVKVMAAVQGVVSYETEEGKKTDEENFAGGSGSGFIVNPNGFVVTNGHVVETIYYFNSRKELVTKEILMGFLMKALRKNNLAPTRENAQKMVEKLKPQVVEMRPHNFVILSNSKEYRFEIKQYSKAITAAVTEKGGEGKDIAVLKIEGQNLPVVQLGDSDKVTLQQAVFAFGFPGAADISFLDWKSRFTEVTITQGTVSAIKRDFKGMPIIQSDVSISWGNSGGPSLNRDGEVIGINSYVGLTIHPFLGIADKAAGVGFIVPVNSVREFLNAAGAREEPSLFNQVYAQALEKIWAKRWFEGKDLLDKALVFIPNQPDILRLKMEVETAINEMNWIQRTWQRNKLILIVTAGIALLIICGGAFFLKKTLRPRKETISPVPQAQPSVAPRELPPPPEETGFGILTLSTGDQPGREFPVGRKYLVIGRESDQCDIAIPDPEVSRVHAWVMVESGDVVILDRGSRNGTYVNNQKVEKAVLKSGDVIQLGRRCPTRLIFKR